MKKKTSLIERVKEAERKEQDAKRRMRQMYERTRLAEKNAECMVVIATALAIQQGAVLHITAEELRKAGETPYLLRQVEDGAVDMVREGYFENLTE